MKAVLKYVSIMASLVSALFGVGSASLWKAAANPETINSSVHSVIALLNKANYNAAEFAMLSSIFSSVSVLCALFANEK